MRERDQGVRLAAAELRIEAKDSANLLGQAHHARGNEAQHIAQALGRIGVGEEQCRVAVFRRGVAAQHLRQIGGVIALADRALQHVGARLTGVEQVADAASHRFTSLHLAVGDYGGAAGVPRMAGHALGRPKPAQGGMKRRLQTTGAPLGLQHRLRDPGRAGGGPAGRRHRPAVRPHAASARTLEGRLRLGRDRPHRPHQPHHPKGRTPISAAWAQNAKTAQAMLPAATAATVRGAVPAG